MLFRSHSLARDFKWLGSYRHGIVHLGGRNEADLRERTLAVSRLLGWTAPYADKLADPRGATAAPAWLGASVSNPGVSS